MFFLKISFVPLKEQRFLKNVDFNISIKLSLIFFRIDITIILEFIVLTICNIVTVHLETYVVVLPDAKIIDAVLSSKQQFTQFCELSVKVNVCELIHQNSGGWLYLGQINRSSELRGFYFMKYSNEMLQNLPFFGI